MNANEILKKNGFVFAGVNKWTKYNYVVNLSLTLGVYLTKYSPKVKRFLSVTYYATIDEFFDKNQHLAEWNYESI